jgi:hypothetical protein
MASDEQRGDANLDALEQDLADAHAGGGICGLAICPNDDCQEVAYERQLVQQTAEYEDEWRRRADLEDAYTVNNRRNAASATHGADPASALPPSIVNGTDQRNVSSAADDPKDLQRGDGQLAGQQAVDAPEMPSPHEEGLDRGHGPDIGLSP